MIRKRIIAAALLFALAIPVGAHTVPLHCGPVHGIISDGGGYGHSTTKGWDANAGMYRYYHRHYTVNQAKQTWQFHGVSNAWCSY